MLKNKKINSQSGIALVEVIAALGIAVMAITALVALSISTLRTSLDSKLLLEGSKVANREIELVRAYRDRIGSGELSWAEFISGKDSTPGMIECSNVSCCISTDGTPSAGECVLYQGTAEEIRYFFTASNPYDGNPVIEGDPVVRISVSVLWQVGDLEKGTYIYTD